MVKVDKIEEVGAYVTLSEYDNKEGMLQLSELSRRRIRSVNKLIKVGRSECVVVVRVEKDVSKRRVYPADLIKCVDRFSRAKAVNSILRHVAEQLGYTENDQLFQLYDKTAWHFDRKMKKKAASYEVFAKAVNDPKVFDECAIESEVRAKLVEEIQKKLTPKVLKIRADIEVSCFSYEGIEAVKKALMVGKEMSTENMPIKINLIAAPLFVVTTQTMDREGGFEAVNKALDAIKECIESYQGSFKVIVPPKVLADLDEEAVKRKMEMQPTRRRRHGH
uniref:Eukaryotic translation initiation factor 2 subunit 1 n=1 Tax=Globodera pallida TaxID=36090 RepID=A0A183CDF8_GLOPA